MPSGTTRARAPVSGGGAAGSLLLGAWDGELYFVAGSLREL
jgi:hypothetical protein